MWSIVGLEPAISALQASVTPNICTIQETNDSADFSSARHGQF